MAHIMMHVGAYKKFNNESGSLFSKKKLPLRRNLTGVCHKVRNMALHSGVVQMQYHLTRKTTEQKRRNREKANWYDQI